LRKLKVIQLVPELNSGGVERGTLELGKFLSGQGHESIVVSNGGRMIEKLTLEGSRHIRMPVHRKNPVSLLQVYKLRKLFLDQKPDVVHARSRVPAWLCFFALKLVKTELRPKFVTTIHGFYSVNAYSKIMISGDHVICVSNSVRDYVLENYPEFNNKKNSVILRGIDHKLYPHGYKPSQDWINKWHEDFPETKNKTLISLPGRVTRLKGHELFIELISELPHEYHGLVVGDIHSKKSEYYRELNGRIKDAGLESRITFSGNRTDIKEILAFSNVVLCLSTKPESFGRTVLEALTLGTPTLGFNTGGVFEILSIIFPEGILSVRKARLIAEKVLLMNENEIKPKPHNYFTIEQMLSDEIRLYQSIA
jgi:glycosyltransferase involved in cell wall biosynthesis